MNIEQTNQVFDHRITEGSVYQWDCFPNARFLDYESDYAHGSVVFNTTNQEIYCAEVNDKEDKFRYRWINPSFIEAYQNEAKSKNVDPNEAWDDVKWVDLDVEEDFLEKAKALFEGQEFDTRVQIPIDFDDDLLFELFKEAHKRDITFNQLVVEAIEAMIEEHKRDPEGVKARMEKYKST